MLNKVDETKEEKEGLDTRAKPVVRIINGALDDDETSPQGIVLNGRIATSSLRFLHVDNSYQRPWRPRKDIFEAIKSGALLPNLDLGVRGTDFTTDEDDFIISDPVFVVDGWQRTANALSILESDPQFPLRVFATLHFGTDPIWERERFTALNQNVKKVSPSLHMRNLRHNSEGVLTLYGLTFNTTAFPLYRKVTWSQSAGKIDLVSAVTLLRAALSLHGYSGGSSVERMEEWVGTIVTRVSLGTFRKNVQAFWDVVDACWGVRNITYPKEAMHIKGPFLLALSRTFDAYQDFWLQDEKTLWVPSGIRAKLAKFPLNDPYIKSLCSTGGHASSALLRDKIVEFINSGRRTHRLTPREARAVA